MDETKFPWEGEPDRLEFIDEATGFKCLIRRNVVSALCGYVIIPEEFIKVAKDKKDDIESLDIHGGVTYFKMKDEDADTEVDTDFVGGMVGFDCWHSYDIAPQTYELLIKEGISTDPTKMGASYKDINFVETECRKLAKQLHELLT